MKNEQIYFMPQPGPQTEAFLCPADELFAGGERGGGKSYLIMGREITGSQQYNLDWNGIVFRRKYKDFKEFRIAFDKEIAKGLPAKRIGGENQINFIKYDWGGTTTLAQAGSLEAVRDWIGHQFTHVSIDEAHTIPFLTSMIDVLKGSMRSAAGVDPRLLLTGNPGGPGAGQIKHMFIPIEYGGNKDNPPEGRVHYVQVPQQDGSEVEISRVFIQLPLEENRILLRGDPKYVNRLKSIQDPVLRAAWLEGRWDVFVGQAFPFANHHVLTPEEAIWPIPSHVPIYMAFDWGWGAPFSVGWYWVDADGRLYRFAEWYGSKQHLPNVGLQLTDPEIAKGILEREAKMGILGRVHRRIAGQDCFRKKPDYKGGGAGPKTADEFNSYAARPEVKKKYGDKVSLRMFPGDDERETKLRQFRNRLMPPNPGVKPMLVVYPQCTEFIRTVPALVVDDVNPEEIMDHQEDHCFDEAARMCNYMPIGISDAEVEEKLAKEAEKKRRQEMETHDRAALEELEQIKAELLAEQEEDDLNWIFPD